MKIEFLWTALAVLCILYGIVVLSAGSGSSFWLFWLAAGLAAALAALCAHTGLWGRMPFPLRAGVLVLVLAGALFFAVIEVLILRHFNDKPAPGGDWMIVLGAQVRENGPSFSLQCRLDAAYEYLAQNPGTRCIVSGGQGVNEPCTEAFCMKEYLVSRGISPDRIYMEEASTNTAENLAFSLALTDESRSSLITPGADHVVIVTNNFHVLRGCAIARKAGLSHVSGLAAKSSRIFLLNNLVREFFGLVKDKLVGNL